jgi:hypothetical protein
MNFRLGDFLAMAMEQWPTEPPTWRESVSLGWGMGLEIGGAYIDNSSLADAGPVKALNQVHMIIILHTSSPRHRLSKPIHPIPLLLPLPIILKESPQIILRVLLKILKRHMRRRLIRLIALAKLVVGFEELARHDLLEAMQDHGSAVRLAD